MLSSNNQSLALYNGCQEVVSKGVLDRFVRLSQPSITLTFNTLEANNKNQQLSRESKLVNAHQYVTGKTLMKSQTSARRIKNSISTLFRGAECFSLARTFRTAWEGGERVGRDFFQTFGGRSLAKCPWKVIIFRTSCS